MVGRVYRDFGGYREKPMTLPPAPHGIRSNLHAGNGSYEAVAVFIMIVGNAYTHPTGRPA